jgi:hypothetical protein
MAQQLPPGPVINTLMLRMVHLAMPHQKQTLSFALAMNTRTYPRMKTTCLHENFPTHTPAAATQPPLSGNAHTAVPH